MPKLICKTDRVVKVDRPKGRTVTFVNNDAANDVYFDTDPAVLLGANVLAGGTPAGTPLVHNGGQLQVADWSEPLYFRAKVDGTAIDVQP